jgi:hypothetical protein
MIPQKMSLVRKDNMDPFSPRAWEVPILTFDDKILLFYTISHTRYPTTTDPIKRKGIEPDPGVVF